MFEWYYVLMIGAYAIGFTFVCTIAFLFDDGPIQWKFIWGLLWPFAVFILICDEVDFLLRERKYKRNLEK